jgi:aminopeptidase N
MYNRTGRFLLLLAFLLPSLAVLAQRTTTEEGKDFNNLVESEKRQFKSIERGPTNNDQQDFFNLHYTRFEWNVDPGEYKIAGTVTHYFVETEPGQNAMHFELSTQLAIDQITYHNQSVSYNQSGDYALDITLPATLAVGSLDSISITYHGAPPSTGFGSFRTDTHGPPPDYIPVMWTLSEPYGARDWWPTKQTLNDKIDSIDVFVRTPEQYQVASNGVLKSKNISSAGFRTWHWKHHHPIPAYLVCFTVTNFVNFDQNVALPNGVDTLRIHHYIYPESIDEAMMQCQALPDIIRLYDTLYGVYAFADEKYGFAQFLWGGGMEHTTMTFVQGWNYTLQSHETAHQWFGDDITCGSWADIWLNEGFATFSEGINYYFGLGDQDFYTWTKNRINNITSQPGGSVWVDDTTSVNRVFDGRLTYNKGCMLLHMLRWKLGNHNFFQGVRNYVKDPALRYGYAHTAQFKAHLEQQSGQDLTEYFNQWFYGQGFPSYHLHWSQTGSTVTLQIGQTTSHPSVPFYAMPVEIRFVGDGQQATMVFDHISDLQKFEFNLPFAVLSIDFDPNLNLLSANNTIDNLLVATTEPGNPTTALQIAPNPATATIHVNLPIYTPGASVVVTLTDMLGRVVLNQVRQSGSFTLDVHSLPAGTYAIHTTGADGNMSGLFVKQ